MHLRPHQDARDNMRRQTQRVSRRRFLGAMAATAGGSALPGLIGLGADASVPPAEFPSTDHFWYRLQPAGRYIDSQRGSKAFAYADGTLLLSEDNGRTWPRRLAFPDAQRITFSH